MEGEKTNPPSHKTKDVALANKQEDIQEEIRDKICVWKKERSNS